MTTELTINGFKLEIGPVSPLAPKAIEVQYAKKNPEPQPPTYEIQAVAGVVETFEHTHETVETEEEKQALLKYQEDRDDWQTGLTQKILKLFLSQGVKLKTTKKQETDFKEQLEVLEIDIPENERELKVLYLELFIINTAKDMQKVIEAVLAETGIKEEALEAANALFPDSVE